MKLLDLRIIIYRSNYCNMYILYIPVKLLVLLCYSIVEYFAAY